MVISSPCLTDIKNWLVQKQTAFGKDFSNPFTADSLLKTIWFSTHHASHAPCYSNEALAIPEQTATGKEISNPFMAGCKVFGYILLVFKKLKMKKHEGWQVQDLFSKGSNKDPIDELITRFRQVCEDAEIHARDAQEEAQEKRLEALENVVQQIRRNNY
ncbi:hypothetical protein Tco_0626368 [Tanacetum coccineum]|uniref:Uncharacterized protein n=1 Tax=Tanacetum coccineum TaxID=301880 RepID=A0ABQ4WJC6_9ASTR